MKIKNAAKKIGSAIYEMEQKSAEKPRILGSSQKQIIFLVLIIIFSFWVGYKLLSYSILDGDKWRMMATDQQLSSVVIKANRGSIYDANGTTLAQSSTVWDVTISPHNIDLSNTKAKEQYDIKAKALIEKGETPEPYVDRAELISQKLSELLGVDYSKIKTACADTTKQYYMVKRKVEKPEANEITAFMNENGLNSDDIYLWPTSKRYYPNDSLASNIIGFTNFDGDGVYEIPTTKPMLGYEDAVSEEQLLKTTWCQYKDFYELSPKITGYYSVADGYTLAFPSRWSEAVTVKLDADTGEAVFYKYMGNINADMTELMRIRTVAKEASDEYTYDGYQLIASRGQIDYLVKLPTNKREKLILTIDEVQNSFYIIN